MPFSNYAEPYQPFYMPTELQVDYRGFKILKRPEFNLYSIVVSQGKKIHKTLEGDYTKLELIRSQIDKFLEKNRTSDAAFTDAAPKRGRPKKINSVGKTIEETAIA
jgi:hypothetical protein